MLLYILAELIVTEQVMVLSYIKLVFQYHYDLCKAMCCD